MTPERFLNTHPVFTREELAALLRSRGRADATVDSHLARWTRQGRIVRAKQGVFVRADEARPGAPAVVDFVALASRMAPDAAVAYHTALEAHGLAQSLFERLFFVTWTKAKPCAFAGRAFVPVRPRVPLLDAGCGERWVERMDRAGLEIRVTTVERTLVDVLDRPELAGGLEEVWRSLSSLPAVDPAALEDYVRLLGRRTTAAKVGLFLETHQEQLAVPATLLKRLQSMSPRTPVAMDRRRGGTLAARWRLIAPPGLLVDDEGVDR